MLPIFNIEMELTPFKPGYFHYKKISALEKFFQMQIALRSHASANNSRMPEREVNYDSGAGFLISKTLFCTHRCSTFTGYAWRLTLVNIRIPNRAKIPKNPLVILIIPVPLIAPSKRKSSWPTASGSPVP